VNQARLFVVGGAVALVGVVLLVFEVVRTVGSNTLGGAGTALLWVGLGLFAAGAVLVTWAVVGGDLSDADVAIATPPSDNSGETTAP